LLGRIFNLSDYHHPIIFGVFMVTSSLKHVVMPYGTADIDYSNKFTISCPALTIYRHANLKRLLKEIPASEHGRCICDLAALAADAGIRIEMSQESLGVASSTVAPSHQAHRGVGSSEDAPTIDPEKIRSAFRLPKR
jgi:hypothetical protein